MLTVHNLCRDLIEGAFGVGGKPLFNPALLPIYVHEKISRDDAEMLFITGSKHATTGQFLVRQSQPHQDDYTLCVMNVGSTITNMRLQRNDIDRIAVPIAAVRGGPFFRTIEGLVTYYQKNRLPALRSEDGGAFFLTTPVVKDKRTRTVRRLLQEDRASSFSTATPLLIYDTGRND